MHWCFSAADGLIISMAQRPLPKHLHLKRMKFPVLCQGLTQHLFEQRAALYFPYSLSSIHRKTRFCVNCISKLCIDLDNDCLISSLGWQAQKRSKINFPGSPAGYHGSAECEPNWFPHQNKDKMERQITFVFKNRAFYLVLVISRRFSEDL